MPSPEEVAAAIQTIDQLTSWLESAGLSAGAIAQFKFNALAVMYPELKEVAQLAKQLIGAAHPVPEVGMGATELAQILADTLEVNIKPEQINKALMALGYQERDEAKRVWKLTEAGSEHGTTLLATSQTNQWSGTQVKWYRSVIPILENYFKQTIETASVRSENSHTDNGSVPAGANAKRKKNWTIAERIKELNLPSNPDQIQLIQEFADEFYTEQYGTNPPKLSGRKTLVSSYPAEAVEVVDRAIQTVFNPKKKSCSEEIKSLCGE
jgi:hypothetical protein